MRRLGLRIFIIGAIAAATLVAGVLPQARAAGREELFIRKGVELRRRGQDKEALEQFRRAYELGKTPRAAAQLGLCEQVLEDWLAAQQHLAEALTAESNPWIAQNKTVLDAARAQTEEPLVRVRIDGSPVGALVVVNQEVAGRLPITLPVFVVPGEVEVDVSVDGYQAFRQTKGGRAGQTLDFKVELSPASNDQGTTATSHSAGQPVRQDPPLPASVPTANRSTWPAWVAVSTGAALIGVGVAFGVKASADAKEARTAPVYDDALVSSANQARTLQWAFLGVGAAAAAVGGMLFWNSNQHEGADVAFSPVPGGGVFALGGSF